YVLDSDWGAEQPHADAGNAFLARHSWAEYAQWHLGLTDGAAEETKARYAFVYGDFRRVHRTGLIACVYRAAEWRHKDVELAAHRRNGGAPSPARAGPRQRARASPSSRVARSWSPPAAARSASALSRSKWCRSRAPRSTLTR